jgi:hypothetical protein
MSVIAPSPPVAITAANEKELVAADVDVKRLYLDVVQKGKPGANVIGSVLDARVRETMSGAPTLTLVIHDPQLELLRSSILWTFSKLGNRIVRPIDIDLDDHPFRLVAVEWDNAAEGSGVDITLSFEHLIVAYLRRHDSFKKISRNKATLAEFIRTFAREVKAVRIRFLCKELHKKQPIEKLSKDDNLSVRDKNRDPGLDTSASIQVKGKDATKAQKKTIETVLRQGEKKDIPHKGLVIAVMVVTQESVAGLKKSNPANPGVKGSFHQDSSYGTVAQRMDDAHAADEFFDRLAKVLKRYPKGGPSYGELADKVQISGNSDAYQQWKDEAADTVKAFTGSGSESTHGYVKPFNYTRGVDGKRENSWDCSQRYADLVNFRSFVTGRATWVYESEPVLFKSRSRMTISRDHPAVISLGGGADTGKRAQTLRIRARVRLWAAPPGSVVTVKGEGLGDDRWLVEDIERSLFSPESDITLKRPTEPKAEPAPEVGSAADKTGSGGDGSDPGGGSGDKSSAMALYVNAKRISDMNLPYVYGGGHGPPLADIRLNKVAIVNIKHTAGLDCSSSCSLALFRAGLFEKDTAIVSGDFAHWGHSGEGKYFTVWYNGEHVWIQFHGLGNAWRFDTSPYGSGERGPHLRFSPRPTSGFKPRHWPGL